MKKNNHHLIIGFIYFLTIFCFIKAKTDTAKAASPYYQSSSSSCQNQNIQASFNYFATTKYVFMIKRVHGGAVVPMELDTHLFKGDQVYIALDMSGIWIGTAASFHTPKPAIYPLGPCNPPPAPAK